MHGIKYEEVSCKIYEKRNKVKILEFGCIPHETIKHFAASPDGICDEKSGNFVGRMVEIKNPVSREITGIPPYEYWVQMQGQLEVTNLEYCDFLECNITEYPSKNAFFEDGTHSMTSNNLEKGVIINILDIENNNKIYKYCDLGLSKKELEIWIDKEIEYIYKSHDLEYIGTTWWKLNTYSCTLIKRDKKWFIIRIKLMNSGIESNIID